FLIVIGLANDNFTSNGDLILGGDFIPGGVSLVTSIGIITGGVIIKIKTKTKQFHSCRRKSHNNHHK
ncbi:unnamed protein product, partial [Rotaria sordida]